MSDCVFCKIAAGEIPSKQILETSSCLVFHDIQPSAPVHALVIPKAHIPTLNDAASEQADILGDMLLAAAEAARKLGVAEGGYRVVFNVNADGGQEVFHIHAHILGGRKLGWPPV